MPNYQVTAPDGRKYRVTAPEGATQEQALAYAQQNYRQAQQPPASGPWEKYQQAAPASTAGPWMQYQQSNGTHLHKIELALRAADAAGNVEDARRLAQAYANERDAQTQPRGQSLAELKAMSPAYQAMSDEDFAQRVYGKYYADAMPFDEFQRRTQAHAQQSIQVEGTDGQKFEFPPGTSQDVMRTALAKHYGGQQQPRADFSNVQSGSNTAANFDNVRSGSGSTEDTQVRGAIYGGPLLAPSASVANAAAAPNLDTINARNRAYQGSPEAIARQQAFEQSQAEAKRKDFQSQPAVMRAAIGAGSRVAAAGRGAAQLGAQAADFVAPRQSNLADLIAGAPVDRYAEAQAREAQVRKDDAYMQGDTAATLGGVGGDLMLLAGPGGALKGLRGLAALAGGAGLGAAYSGLQPVVAGESRGVNAAVGGAFGVAGHGVASGVSALGRRAAQAIPADVRQMAQRAGDLGIPLHASQVSQSLPVKVAASAGKYLPFSGYGKAASRQQEGINRAVAKTFGADAPKLTDDVMQRARQDLSREFETIYNRHSVPINANGARKLAAVENEAARRLTKDEAQVLRNQLDDILANADDGVLTGQKYQAVRTALRKAEGNDKLGMAVRELRQTLDDIAADAVGPQDSAALKALRSKWANFRTAEAAMKQNSGAGGDVRLGALWPLIRKGSTKEMRELARMGQTVLKDPISDSGTAQRTLLYNLVMGTGSIANPALIPLIAKAAAGGATIGRAANSNTLAKLLARESRGVPTSKLGSLMQRGNPYLAPAAAVEYNDMGGR